MRCCESLKRFLEAVVKITNPDMKIALTYFLTGLHADRLRKLVKEFLARLPKDLSEAHARAKVSISMAEALDTFATVTKGGEKVATKEKEIAAPISKKEAPVAMTNAVFRRYDLPRVEERYKRSQ